MERTATARGTSGRIDRDDSVLVEIRGCYGIRRFGLSAEQALDLRQRGQRTLFRPRLNLFGRELQQSGQVLVAIHTELGAQRALAHAAIDQGRHLRFRLGFLYSSARLPANRWARAENEWKEVIARYSAASDLFDLDGPLCPDRGCAVLPLGDKALGCGRTHFRQQGGERCLRQPLLFSIGEDVHWRIISPAVSLVNSPAICEL